jgi:hypothetical protein
MGSHEANNSAMREYAAKDGLTRAAKLIELSMGIFPSVDDQKLLLALLNIRDVVAYHSKSDPKPVRDPIPGDVRF